MHYLEQFKEYFIIKGYTTKSIQSISKNIEYFLNWIETENITIEEITNNDILAYIQYKRKAGNKPKTLQLIIINLNHYFNFLVAEYHLNENPASNVKIQGVKRKTLQEILTPVELEKIYKTYNTNPQQLNSNHSSLNTPIELARKRNKIILGLLVYQGLKVEDITKLQLQDLQLREGKITIQANARSATRTLKLEAHQIIDILDYINQTRKQILLLKNVTLSEVEVQTTQLFISTGTSLNLANSIQKLVKTLKKNNPKLKDIKQIRASVITNWLKVYNLRKTQYMAGHRYVSSTESYQVNNIDALHDDITKFHPLN